MNGTIEGNGIRKSEGAVRRFKTAQYIYIVLLSDKKLQQRRKKYFSNNLMYGEGRRYGLQVEKQLLCHTILNTATPLLVRAIVVGLVM